LVIAETNHDQEAKEQVLDPETPILQLVLVHTEEEIFIKKKTAEC